MNDYQKFIHKSRYAKWDKSLGRREGWPETVNRYLDYFDEDLSPAEREELFKAIVSMEVMPSMRCMMVAGEALSRSNVAGFNCSAVAVNKVRTFDEALFILMNGTGLGFSCERQYIADLPVIKAEDPNLQLIRKTTSDAAILSALDGLDNSHLRKTCEIEEFYGTDPAELSLLHNNVIYVADSKEGWASALRILIVECYNCNWAISWDVSKVRPAGAKLKVFGGRASGPNPLVQLFKYVKVMFKAAEGRKLQSIEIHKLLCKIAEIVICGGVRRSALISLSNLSDQRMARCKSGAWWESAPELALANNSVAYTEKPDMSSFMTEWQNLYSSKSGERGIFNRQAANIAATKSGRRDSSADFLCNPCCFTGSMRLLTAAGYKRFDVLVDTPSFEIISPEGVVTTGIVWESGSKHTVAVHLNNGKIIKCTPDHIFKLANNSELQASLLEGQVLQSYLGINPLVISVIDLEVTTVYDFTEPANHWGVVEGVIVHNSEINLVPDEFCNLSEAVVRSTDSKDDIKRKVRIATILGSLQATMTDFHYLSPSWKYNTENEALLGVSLTGIMDNKFLSEPSDELELFLEDLKEEAVMVNKEWALKLGINQSAAISCVKPSGTVSQLVDSASGIHARYSDYYVRTVRQDIKDPITAFLKEQGVPNEPCVMKPDSTVIFSFPMKAPSNAVMRNDRGAIEQLEHWLLYQRHWCEHKPSVTVYVKEDEWFEVGAWVYKHFDEVSGVSFLPHSDHTYAQAPYQEINEEEYHSLLEKMPNINWGKLQDYEKVDTTTVTQELACTAGGCDIL